MGKDERSLSAAAAAKALGVSKRALQFYEEKGLVKPVRTAGGWRAYDTQALAQLHQILALKRMGFELSKIARVLKGALSSLDSVLALQEQNLAARHAETYRALGLVRRARAQLSCGEALSVDDLTTLTRETTMDGETLRELYAKEDRIKEARGGAIHPFAGKYLTPEENKRIKANREQPGYYETAAEALALMQAAMKTGDPQSPEARDAARLSRVANTLLYGGDLDLARRVRRMVADAMKDPAARADLEALPAFNAIMTPDYVAFSERAMKALEAWEKARG